MSKLYVSCLHVFHLLNFCFIEKISISFSAFAAFNLIEGIDVAAIEAKIAKYQEENAEQIMINRAQKVLVRMVSSLFQSLPYMPLISLYDLQNHVNLF